MQYDIKSGARGLIFDLDGTLADTMPYHYKGWRLACLKYGVDIGPEFLRKYVGSPGWFFANDIIRLFNLEGVVTADELLTEKLNIFENDHSKVKPIMPVVSIVKKYHNVLPIAVGTGGHREGVERTLEVTGLRDYFDIIVTANDVENYKPHPETFLKCAEKMGVSPEFIEVFEDGDLGLEAAREAGMMATDVRSWYDSEW
jgi:beta-phosphoglucomutase-like phosphatase (HAD superfamily)